MKSFELESLILGYDKKIIAKVDNKLWNQKGMLTGIVGLNGSGKTSLFRTLSGLLKPLQGQTKLGGKKITDIPVRKRAQLITLVPSLTRPARKLNVWQLLSLGRLAYHPLIFSLDKDERAYISQWAECFGIQDWLHKDCSKLSDGQLQKVSLARAWIQDTNIVLLDEPTAHLDWQNRERIFELIAKLSEPRDKLVLVASHDLDMVEKHCEEVGLIQDKELKWLQPENLKTNINGQ